jgi:DNA repair exonuclease SbcCD ATPase subunit
MADFIDKTKEFVTDAYNSTKLHARIIAEETKIRELYYKLGREYYYDLENDVDDISGLEELCEDIKQRLEKINAMKKKASACEHLKTCSVCGALSQEKNLYCGKCGAKL